MTFQEWIKTDEGHAARRLGDYLGGPTKEEAIELAFNAGIVCGAGASAQSLNEIKAGAVDEVINIYIAGWFDRKSATLASMKDYAKQLREGEL